MTQLDEKGFVFENSENEYWLCRMWGDEPWFFYQHPDGPWVSYKKVDQTLVWAANRRKVSDEIAEECNRKAKMI